MRPTIILYHVLNLATNYRGIHRQTHIHRRPIIILSFRVFVAAGTCLPSRCLTMKGEIHFIEPLSSIERRDTQTHRQHGDRISLLPESKLTKNDNKTVDRACLTANAIFPPPPALRPHINVTRAGRQVFPVRYQDVFYKVIILWFLTHRDLYRHICGRHNPPPKRKKLWKELVYTKRAEIKNMWEQRVPLRSQFTHYRTVFTNPKNNSQKNIIIGCKSGESWARAQTALLLESGTRAVGVASDNMSPTKQRTGSSCLNTISNI
jgi:hypothetical protein